MSNKSPEKGQFSKTTYLKKAYKSYIPPKSSAEALWAYGKGPGTLSGPDTSVPDTAQVFMNPVHWEQNFLDYLGSQWASPQQPNTCTCPRCLVVRAFVAAYTDVYFQYPSTGGAKQPPSEKVLAHLKKLVPTAYTFKDAISYCQIMRPFKPINAHIYEAAGLELYQLKGLYQDAVDAYIPVPKKEKEKMPISTSVWRFISNSGAVKSAKTQKVRGMRVLGEITNYLDCGGNMSAKWCFAGTAEYLAASEARREPPRSFPVFARPCPEVPRHGFVDSRVVRTAEELTALIQETHDIDPNSEILLAGFIKSDMSAVMTPTTFSVGRGHEGATSGKSETVYGPGMPTSTVEKWRKAATIKEGDVPYVELVSDEMNVVQCRGGPPLASVVDYVKSKVTVKKILVATEGTDLIQWEKDIMEADSGTVVYADGLSLASHFCVHAVVHNVPVLTSRKPEIGETLEPTGVPKWTRADWKRLADFIREAEVVSCAKEYGWVEASLGVAGLHLAGTPAPATDAQLRALAYGAVFAVKGLSAACIGEARHLDECSESKSSSTEYGRRSVATVRRARNNIGGGRDVYYEEVRKGSISALAEAMRCIPLIYGELKWNSSYGGKRWKAISDMTLNMAVALRQFKARPSPRKWAAVITFWNEAINLEHNGKSGALSKFGIYQQQMDKYASNPLRVFAMSKSGVTRLVFFGPSEGRLRVGAKNMVKAPRHRKEKVERYKGTVKLDKWTATSFYVRVGPGVLFRVDAKDLKLSDETGLLDHAKAGAPVVVEILEGKMESDKVKSVRALARLVTGQDVVPPNQSASKFRVILPKRNLCEDEVALTAV